MLSISKDLETGIPHIDAQHRELVDMINQFMQRGIINVKKEEVEKSLGFLGDYVVKHFSDEEKAQLESGYPAYAQHRQIHQDFIVKYKKLLEEYKKTGPTAQFLLQVNTSVVEWIVKHIKSEDVKFGRHYSTFKNR